MRRALFAVALLWTLLPLPAPGAQAAPGAVITAQQIALYSDRGMLLADGGVSLRMPGLRLDATHAVYDLRANRLTANGTVTVADASGSRSGSGYVYDFASKHGAFNNNATVPQYASADAVAIAQQVELQPGQSITFTNGQVRSGSVLSPVASYTYGIPRPNAKDYGYSPVPSAALEYPFIVSSSSNEYSFARLRYDRYNGGEGIGLEEHYAASDRGYVAVGETLDADGGRLDLAAYEKLSDDLSQSFTGSTLYGVRDFRYSLTETSRSGYLSLSSSQYDGERSDDLTFQANQHNLGRIGSYHLEADLGHDVHPGDWDVAQDMRITPGVHLDTATAHVGAASLSGSFDLGEAFYDYGRATIDSTSSFWGTYPMNSHALWSGGMTFSHNAPPYPSTYRTYNLGVTWKTTDAFNLVTSLQYNHDFGQEYDYGRPEFSAAFDVRVKRRDGRGYEIGTILPFGGVGNLSRQAVLNFRFFK